MTSRPSIVVLGATGRQGGAVVRHLLSAGWPVHAFVRDRDSNAAQVVAAAGATLVEGDMEDPSSLRRAFNGAYGVFSMQTWRGPGGVPAEKAQGLAVAQAASDAGIAHLVYSSVGGADRAPELAHFASKWVIEQRIAELGIPSTVLRPVFFMDNFAWQAQGIANGKLVQGALPDTKLQMIAVDDIGVFAALAFENPDQWLGRTVEIAGDELTLAEAAQVFADKTGRPVEYQAAHEDRPGGGDEARKMAAWFDANGFTADIAALRELHPGLQDLRTYVSHATWI